MNKAVLSFTLLFLLGFVKIHAQVPAPAPAQKQAVYITNATIHCGNGQVLKNATIGVENGKIVFLEENAVFKTDQTMGKVIDGSGKHIYPGLIALNTKMGLDEIESVRATNDYSEVGLFNPNVRALIAYNTDSRVTPTVRSNGVMYAQVCPEGGWVSGTSSLVQLDAWNWEDAAVVADEGLWMSWPSMFRNRGWWGDPQGAEVDKNYDKNTQQIKDYFAEAMSYSYSINSKTNLRFEAMKDVFSGKKTWYVRVDYVKEILHVLQFAKEFGLKPVLVGASDSWMIADQLAAASVSVILGKTHRLPQYPDEDIDQPYKTPSVLQKAGVVFSISIPEGFWQERNLAFNAGTAAAYGLSKEEALQSITLNAAKILKADKLIGSLEKGKNGTLIVCNGDILNMKESHVEYALIDGREIDLNNKQKALYEKYKQKYNLR